MNLEKNNVFVGAYARAALKLRFAPDQRRQTLHVQT
jgi:hypothetical protein